MRNNFLRPLSTLMMFLGLLLVGSGCERAKTKLDREVDRLCAIDGGVKIYERVTLSAENFGPNGEVFPQYQHLTSKGGQLGPEYRLELTRTELIAGDPVLVRWTEKITRKQDNKLLAERVDYERGGGDFYGLHQPSSYLCKSSSSKTIVQEVFKEGNKS